MEDIATMVEGVQVEIIPYHGGKSHRTELHIIRTDLKPSGEVVDKGLLLVEILFSFTFR